MTEEDSTPASSIARTEIGPKLHPGGNITVSAGKGTPGGSIIFEQANGEEAMRFDGDGKVFIRGEQVDDNIEVYAAFRYWLSTAFYSRHQDEGAMLDVHP